MYANHRHYILFTLAFVAFLIATGSFFLLRKGIFDQAVFAADLSKQVNALEEQAKHEHDVNSAYAKFIAAKEIVKNAVVTKDTVVNFIETFEKIGTDTSTDLQLSRIESQEIIKTNKIQDNFGHMKAHVEVSGTWQNVMRAFVLIQNVPYGILFDNIHLAQEGNVTVETASTTSGVAKPRNWHLSMDMSILMTK